MEDAVCEVAAPSNACDIPRDPHCSTIHVAALLLSELLSAAMWGCRHAKHFDSHSGMK